MDHSYICDEMYNTLQREIIGLTIEPGSVLSENKLCERFSVSRTPVRSVLQRLQENQLVKIVPYKSTTVTRLHFDIIEQLIYMRVAVESNIIRDYIPNCSVLEMEQLRYLLSQMEQEVEKHRLTGHCNVDAFFATDCAMHEIWFRSMRKMYLWDFFQNAHADYSRFRLLDMKDGQNYEDVYAEHKEILRIIEENDLPAIEPLLRKHLFGGVRRLGPLLFNQYKDYFVSETET